MAELKVLVVSDVHASEMETADSYVSATGTTARHQNPLVDLIDWLEEEAFTADILLAPGDISNKADAGGLLYGWQGLNDMARRIGARLVAAPGNHDLITHASTGDARAILKSLTPSFPTGDSTLDSQFWESGWACLEGKDHRILVLDTTFDYPPLPSGILPYDGSAAWSEYSETINRGGLTKAQLDEVGAYLRDKDRKLNVALLHHHPQEHQLRDFLKDWHGPLRLGDDLIDLLDGRHGHGRWIIVHGHKHIPQLSQAVAASANGPLILGSASASASIWPPQHTVTRNQFHVLNASDDFMPGAGSIRGRVTSYAWGFGVGWQVAPRTGSGLPGLSGFGCADDSSTLADSISRLMDDLDTPIITVEELVARLPQFEFQLPGDFLFLESVLGKIGLQFVYDRQGFVLQIVRRK